LLYRVADPGPGFSFKGLTHAAVGQPAEDPVAHVAVRDQLGIRPGGFGIIMTRSMADELMYNEAQNEVIFVKYLTSATAPETAAKCPVAAPRQRRDFPDVPYPGVIGNDQERRK